MSAEHPVIGPLFSAHKIEEAVLRNLKRWLPGYLSIACEIHGIEEGIAGVESWDLGTELESFPENALPALLVACEGILEEPEKGAGGMYRAEWGCEVGIAIAAANAVKARIYSQVYAAAIRGALMQRRTLGDDGQVSRWLGEVYGRPEAIDDRRSRSTAAVAFAVRKDEVLSWTRGPGTDAPPIPDGWPVVKETATETEIQP